MEGVVNFQIKSEKISTNLEYMRYIFQTLGFTYRVTIQVRPNLLLSSKLKFRFGLARHGQTRPKRNFGF